MAVFAFEKMENNQAFMMPSVIVDKFVNQATLSDFKVILYIIRNSGKTYDDSTICSQLMIDEKQLKESIDFWIKNSVLVKRGGIISINYTSCSQTRASLPEYSGETIEKKAMADKNLSMLLEKTEQILNTTLTPADISVLFGIYDYLGMPIDVILMLVSYAAGTLEKKNMRYIEKIAIDWSDKGITNIDVCNNYISMLEARGKIENKVKQAFGIGTRSLTKKEQEFIYKWAFEFNFSIDMIVCAYERNVDAKGNMSFAYINSILKSWYEKGYRSVLDTQNDLKKKIDSNKEDSSMSDYLKTSWEIIKKASE